MVIDKVLDNKGFSLKKCPRKVVSWFAATKKVRHLSERLTGKSDICQEEMRRVDPHSIPEVKMKRRFMNEIKCERTTPGVGLEMDVGGGCCTVCFLCFCFLANRWAFF